MSKKRVRELNELIINVCKNDKSHTENLTT